MWARLKPHAAKLVASLVIAAGFVWMFQRGGLPFLPTSEVVRHIRWWCVPAYVGTLLLCTILRTYRWVYLLRAIAPVDSRRVLGVGLIGYGIILFAPLRTGELARPLMIARDGSVSFTQATGTVAAERIIDGLLVSLLLLAGILTAHPLDPLPDHLGALPLPVAAVPRATYAALAVFTCAFGAMGVFYWARDGARKLTHAVIDVVSPKLATWLTDKVERVADGLAFLPSKEHGLPFFRDTLLYWVVCLALSFVGLRGCGVPVTLAQNLALLGVMALGILIPSGPGFFGAYQLSGYCALAMFFPEPIVLGPGAAFIFVSYTSQLIVTLVGMLVGALLLRGLPPSAPLDTAPSSPPGEASP
jgi:glycosyltransferase 2 family protein